MLKSRSSADKNYHAVRRTHPALAAAMENRTKAIDAFMDAATERQEEMQDNFDCDNDPVVAMMWTLIEELEG